MRHLPHTLLLLALLLSFALLPGSGLARAAEERCFPETSQCIAGRFREYWEQNGGLSVFGFPITPARAEVNRDTGQSYLTQWFERNRFELHPENGAPYDVLLGRLSDERLRLMGVDWQAQPREGGPKAGCLWFEQTGRNVCDQANGLGFKSYWRTHGLKDSLLDARGRSLALFGLPLTEATMQVSPWDGRVFLIQWFERARFEWHPDEPDTYKVLLGLLGNEVRMNTADAPERGQIAFVRDGDIYVMSAGGGQPMRLTTNAGAPPSSASERPVWSPDGQRIAFNAGWDLIIMSSDGAEQTRLTQHTGMPEELEPAWSPDSQRIAFRLEGEIYIATVDGSQRVRLTTDSSHDACPDWSPDGRHIAFISYRDDHYEIIARDLDTGGETRLARGGCPAWSPDGRRIAFGADDGVYVMNRDGSGIARLTTLVATGKPTWSPDGKRIAFASLRGGFDYDIYVVSADGGMLSNLTNNPARDDQPTWSPDGHSIAFASDRTGSSAIYTMKADGTEQTYLASGDGPAWSPR